MIKSAIIISAGVAVLWLFPPTYDQIGNGWAVTMQLGIMAVGVVLVLGGALGAVAAIRG